MMFLGVGNFASQMQSRVLRLGLDHDQVSAAQLVKDLQCSKHFTADSFPAHKTWLICQAVASGKLMADQYKCIDGLRAWALILLLFGRKFKYKQIELAPILNFQNANNSLICSASSKMMALQEMRNLAAHRGTILKMERLEEMRQYSFDVLNELNEILK
jgi:hypothetical protein